MNIPLIFFFIALLGIIYIMGRKFMVLNRKTHLSPSDEAIVIDPNIDTIQYIAIKKLKKYGYVLILASLRFSLKTGKWIKEKWYILASKFQTLGRESENGSEGKEISKFLQNISEYKKRIKEMKDKIKQEEGLD